MPPPERLNVLDDAFLHLEGPATPMHVGGLALFEGPSPGLDAVTAAVAARLDTSPRWRQRVQPVPWELARPVWVDDGAFDIGNHIHHGTVAAPGDAAALNRLTATILAQPLVPERPLWELWLLDGLEDGRFTLLSKIHHCSVDGASAMDMTAQLLDPSPHHEAHTPVPWRPRPAPTRRQLLDDARAERRAAPARLLDSLQAKAAGNDNALRDAARALGALLAAPPSAGPSSLNRPVEPGRRLETVVFELAELRHIADELDATINDVALAAVTGGLRRLLEARGEDLGGLELRALVPVSLRRARSGGPGNHISALFATLPVHEDDPGVRLGLISARTAESKASGQARAAELLTLLGEQAPPVLLAPAVRLLGNQRAYDLVVTNVPGPPTALYCLGRRMLEVYPVVPLTRNTPLNVALLSYDGRVGFGLLGDGDAAPDLSLLAEGIEKAVAELGTIA